MPKSELVQSVLRSAELIKLIASAPGGMRLTQIADESNLLKSTAYNLLRTLCTVGFLEKDANNFFRIGAELQKLTGLDHSLHLRSNMIEALKQLHEKFPQDVLTVSTFELGAVRCMLRMAPGSGNLLQEHPGRTFPPYISMTGLALHCYWGQMIEQQFPFDDYGLDMWESFDNFSNILQKIRQIGYCWKQRNKHWAAAFIMPEGWVLGFSTSGEGGNISAEVNLRHSAAAEFCKNVWFKEQK